MSSTSDKTNQQITLADGRRLGYAEYGAPQGKPVLYFHGFPSSRLEWPLFDTDATATQLGARIIAVDRPGMGLSDFKRGRRLLDWPNDVAELADALQLDRFSVLGMSGGGPYAAACALMFPGRLAAAAIVSGMGPSQAPGARDGTAMLLPGKTPWMRRLLLIGMAAGLRRDPDRIISRFEAESSEPDRAFFARPEVRQMFIDTLREAVHPGTRGASWEGALYARPWGFRLEDISSEVHLWHGDLDANVPPSVGRYVAEAIPNCRARFYPDEGHVSLGASHMEEILNALVF